MEYYDVHCVHCGAKNKANIMAFDFDSIIKKHYDILYNKGMIDEDSKFNAFREVRLGLYFSHMLLINQFHLMEEQERASQMQTLSIFAGQVLQYMNSKYKVDIEADFYSSGNKAGFRTGRFHMFCDKFRMFVGDKDSDKEIKRELIKNILIYFIEHKEDSDPIFECQVRLRKAEDDQGNKFVRSMDCRYQDGTQDYIGNMVCIWCGEPFHPKAGVHKEYIIGMVGSARVGKTAYLAALVDALHPEYGNPPYENVQVSVENDKGWENFYTNVLKHYRLGEKIAKTNETDEMVSLFTMKCVINRKDVLFTFIDMPGEAFVPSKANGEQSEFHFIIEKRPILRYTDIFWFCIDPTQVDRRLASQNGVESSDDKVETDMDMVMGYIKPVLRYLNEDKRLKAAIMITKSDLIPSENGLFQPDQSSQQPLVEGQYFRTDRFVNFSEQVKDYFKSPTVKHLIPDFQEMFHDFHYFAVAAYGRKVVEENRKLAKGEESRGNKPSHIVEPFLWTLACLGILTPGRLGIKKSQRFLRSKEETVMVTDEEAKLYSR